jgi:hypothetical protein
LKTLTFKKESKIFPIKKGIFLLLASNGRREYLFVIKSMQIIVTPFMNPTFLLRQKVKYEKGKR